MSRRGRSTREAGGRPAPAVAPRADAAAPRPAEEGPSLRDQLRTATVPAGALLPLRFFFGITFLYAGIDKLIDPSFFDPSSPTSIMAQMADFTRASPLAPLVKVGEPVALLLGLLIAMAEIGIGLGALTGLAFRVAAAGGAALSLLFWLTASWSTHPYYFGPDLPYAAGWIALALAGHGGLLVPRRVRELGRSTRPATDRRGGPATATGTGRAPRPAGWLDADEGGALTRRTLIQVGLLAGAALAVGAASMPLRLLRGGEAGTGSLGGATPAPGASPTPSSSAAPTAPASSAPGGGVTVATVSDLANADAVTFTVPAGAPAPLPAGDPGVIVKLADGSYVAFDAVCTHEGCTVEWDAADAVLLCPCHGAAFDPANNAAVLQGPTRQPLAALPLVVDAATGTISLQA